MNSEQWIVWLSLFSRRSNRPEIVEPTEVTCWNIGSFNMLKPSCVIWMESSQFFLEATWMLLLFWTLFHSYLLPLGQLLLRPQKMHVAWSFCPSATRSSLGSFGSAQTNVKCQQMSTNVNTWLSWLSWLGCKTLFFRKKSAKQGRSLQDAVLVPNLSLLDVVGHWELFLASSN